jgi:hypothetical protein
MPVSFRSYIILNSTGYGHLLSAYMPEPIIAESPILPCILSHIPPDDTAEATFPSLSIATAPTVE